MLCGKRSGVHLFIYLFIYVFIYFCLVVVEGICPEFGSVEVILLIY